MVFWGGAKQFSGTGVSKALQKHLKSPSTPTTNKYCSLGDEIQRRFQYHLREAAVKSYPSHPTEREKRGVSSSDRAVPAELLPLVPPNKTCRCWKHSLGFVLLQGWRRCRRFPQRFPAAETLSSFAFQVQCLERQNQALMAKWELLQQQSTRPEESRSIASFFQSYISNLQRQLEMLQNQKEQLDPEAYNMLQLVEDYKNR